MMINVISPHIGAFVKICVRALKKCCDRSCRLDKRNTKQLLQTDYENLYIGPEFLIEVRYSQVLTSFFILMIYSSGMPLLYLVGVVQFCTMYWVDKFLFVRVYRKPPSYGMELASIARSVIVYAIILHLCFGFYMFSNSAIFTYEGDFLYLDFVKDYF